jgi:hypothetical protein
MILAIVLALLPVAFVAAMATRDLRPWRRTLKYIRALPELSPGAATNHPEVRR